MFGGKKKKQNLNFIIGSIIFLAVALIAVLFFTRGSNESKKIKSAKQPPEMTEEQKIMNANKEAIAEAVAKDYGQIAGISEADHIIGNLGAPVEYIVYGDFEDPFSADYSATVKKVIENFGDKIVTAFRHFPLTTTHNNAMEAAIASECAGEQNKFWEMHDKLFENNAAGKLNNEQYLIDAEELDLNIDKFKKCLNNKEREDEIYKQIADARQAGVLGTPASFVNGQSLPGAYQFDDFIDSGKYDREGMNTIITRHLQKAEK